jgi:hypothetical protein
MPTSVTVTTTYAGEKAPGYIAATLLASKTIDAVTQHLNVPYKLVLKKYANEASFADLTCDFTPTGTVTLTEASLTPKQLQWQEKICKLEFIDDWESASMGFGNARTLPKEFGDFMLNNMAEAVTARVETLMWQGEAANAGEFDGFYAQLGSAVDVAGSVITANNVIAELQKVVDAIPTTVKSHRGDDVFIYVPTSVLFFYAAAKQALGTFQGVYEGFGEDVFLGFPLVHCPGMLDNTMVAARKSNMHFGTGLLSDFTDVKLIDQGPIDGSENVNVSIKFSADTAVGYANEIVYYLYES